MYGTRDKLKTLHPYTPRAFGAYVHLRNFRTDYTSWIFDMASVYTEIL